MAMKQVTNSCIILYSCLIVGPSILCGSFIHSIDPPKTYRPTYTGAREMCPPLLSDSLDITCSYNSTYANCSNLSIPGTIATPKCKPAYALPNGQKETPIEIHCQSNGTWNNELYTCDPARPCVLLTVEGVVYTYEDSNESLSHGTLIHFGVTVNENCTFGYHNFYPKSGPR